MNQKLIRFTVRCKSSIAKLSIRARYMIAIAFVIIFGGVGTALTLLSHASPNCTPNSILVNPCRPLLGAAVEGDPRAGSSQTAQFSYLEKLIGRQLDVYHDYHAPGSIPLNSTEIYYAKRANTTDYINYKPAGNWASADGSNASVNASIDKAADNIKAIAPHKVFLTIWHEPENDVSGGTSCHVKPGHGGTPAQYRAMWQNVESRFKARGVTNVVWVMNYMGYSGWDCLVPQLWPGNNLVDWVTFDTYGTDSQPSWASTVGRFYGVLRKDSDATHNFDSKPWGAAEFGTCTMTNEQHAYQYYQSIKSAIDANTYPNIKMYMIYDSTGNNAGPGCLVDSTHSGSYDGTKLANFKKFADDGVFSHGTPLPTQPSPPPSPSPSPSSHPQPGSSTSSIPRFSHIVVAIDENHGYKQIIGPTSYITSLSKQGANFINAHALAHPSEPNYLMLFSGSNQGITTDYSCAHKFGANNLGAQLLASGNSFVGYSESLPSVGYRGCNTGPWAERHVPWASFNDIPSSSNQPYTAFPTNYAQLPTVSFVVPNVNNDMHNGTIAQGDAWLKANLGSYVTWAKTHNSLLILTFDEDEGTSPNTIPTIMVGANVKPGNYSEYISHYTLLRTLETMYGLAPLGGAASTQPIKDVWTTAKVTASTGSSGSTTSNSGGVPHRTPTPVPISHYYRVSEAHGTPIVYVGTPIEGRGEQPPISTGNTGTSGGNSQPGGVYSGSGSTQPNSGNSNNTTVSGLIPLRITRTIELEPNEPSEYVGSVSYYLGKKLLATVNKPPFAFQFNPRDILNGKYDLTAKVYLTDGSVQDTSFVAQVSNPFSLTQARLAAVHYLTSGISLAVISIIIIGSALAYLVRKFLAWRKNNTPHDEGDFFGTASY